MHHYTRRAEHPPASSRAKGTETFPTEHGGVDSIKLLLGQEGIEMNLEQNEVEILSPVFCSRYFPPK